MEIHLGIDDTDSHDGMCTTYLASTIIDNVEGVFQLPELIRLNPNIPWKTRGNGALAIRGQVDNYRLFKKNVIKLVEELREPTSNTGVVFFKKDPREIKPLVRHSRRAIKTTLDIDTAVNLGHRYGEVYSYGNGRGVVGALASASHRFKDMTYELLAYRHKNRWGTPREVEEETIYRASQIYNPLIWDTVDWKHKKNVITPNSPCPVLYGVRGDFIEPIEKTHNLIEGESVAKTTVFKTNQGTDEHITPMEIGELTPMTSCKVDGVVVEPPRSIKGGHVIFTIKDDTGTVDCAAYEPTKKFRNKIRKLIVGDKVVVYGGVKPNPLTINIEKLSLQEKTPKTKFVNPTCPECNRNMESAGKNQGYRCRKCKTTEPDKKRITIKRELKEGYIEVPPIARRHLAKPLIRMELGYDRKNKTVGGR
ncbi:tRNA(Ile2) 2-agmatinylcytidine synthetase, containing Zn-ribbon and OB-fold domain TiaS [Methanonatronarchaeum thermophilum]|uniref:tRNA(Ile2) 2-agmatinylcytidine synthetase TiaS n=1 Tax=Methanonatronarchaeum thermophilum TaxID=1927129 RepID=A0A1Y3G9L2_9EURY|nr:tRNA(Ile)(2)-agmatinylcytidine synthase [Methanonatronarchaeum thermophilum]OUJ18132.1 tRNA(Ile2) 2-agmatinylcytidine synthetase, containing Zn-ribbon and OB-fold domain TiaS [Methanonatronarchaeum thermophilum]